MSETLYGQASPTGASGYSTTTENGTYGVYFTVSQAATLDAIWFYSPSGAASLPTATALYSTTSGSPTTGTQLAANASPSWSGAAGSGWVRDNSFPATALSTGTAYVGAYYGASFKQAYIYTGAEPAALFPATSSPTGLITAPVDLGSTVYCNGPYHNSANAYTGTWNSGANLNWLADVEVSAGTGGPAQISGPAQFIYQPPAWHPASGPGMPGGEPFAAYPLAPYASFTPPVTPQTGPWSLFGVNGNGATGPSTATASSGDWISAVTFEVTQGGQWLEGYWWWVCASGQSTSPVKCALWCATGTDTGTLISAATVTSGTLTAGQWNWIPLATPVQIAIGTTYVAAIGVNGSYPSTSAQFGSGDPYSAGITSGPLTAYSDTSGSLPPQYFLGQGLHTTAGSDPSLAYPDSAAASSANLWADVQVSGAAPAGYAGTWQLWPANANADQSTAPDSAVGYVVGTEFWLSEPCTVGEIAYYSPAGTAQLATAATIWNVVTQAQAYNNATPSWSGAAGSGWVSCAVTGVTLQPGAYRVSVYNGAGSPDNWSAKRLGYWGGGGSVPGGGPQVTATGITSGPLFAPSSAQANNCYEYDVSGAGNTPPYSYPSGIQEPGQSVFAQSGSNSYPSLYVDALYQNYWVDIQVTAVATTASAGLATGTGTAQSPVPDVMPAAGNAAGTGTAQPPSAVITPAAGLAAGTGAALAPVPVVTASAGLATAAGGAQQPGTAITPIAGLAAAAGVSQPPVPVIVAAAGLTSGTGTAQAPALAVTVNAGLPAGTGTAQPPVPVVTADAGLAAGTGTAWQPTVTTSGNTTADAGLATAAGSALAPVPVIIPAAGLASGTGTAQQPGTEVDASAGLATGSGNALAPVPVVIPAAGLPTGAGAAQNPTVNTSGSTTANAGLATASGAALQPVPAVQPGAGLATGTGTAQPPVPAIAASPALAIASGSAPMPVISVTVFAGLATGTGTAQQPVAGIIFTATAGLATATGAAQQPGVTVMVMAGLAAGTGTALQATGPGIITAIVVTVVTARQQWGVTTARQLWSVPYARN